MTSCCSSHKELPDQITFQFDNSGNTRQSKTDNFEVNFLLQKRQTLLKILLETSLTKKTENRNFELVLVIKLCTGIFQSGRQSRNSPRSEPISEASVTPNSQIFSAELREQFQDSAQFIKTQYTNI